MNQQQKSTPSASGGGLGQSLGSRSLVPRGGCDNVWTPDSLAKQIVDHFSPFGTMAHVLEPCEGQGAFTRALLGSDALFVSTCEIDRGEDFFDWEMPVDWIITNPPWSKCRAFLRHGMTLADNIVFLITVNHFLTKARRRDMREAGFGFVEIFEVDTPPAPWPQSGFQLGAIHIRRGHSGPTIFSSANKENTRKDG